MKQILLKLIVLLLQIIKYVFVICIFISIFGILKPYISNLKSYPALNKVVIVDSKINQVIKNNIPTIISKWDLSRLITIVILIIIINILNNIIQRFRDKLQIMDMNQEIKELKKSYQDTRSDKISELESTLKGASVATNKKTRKELLKEFVSIKKELEKSGRELAFLSVDVVNSTLMKQNEEQETVEHDFYEYHQFVENQIKKNGYIKASWTPDGIMVCFNTVDDAVKAGCDIINGLIHFNKEVKLMKHDFAVRCGINAGFVYFDETTPLEEISDRVIDIAGHMQKHALPNTVSLPKTMIEPLKYKSGFEPSPTIVDGLEVFQWKANIKSQNE